MSILCPHCHNLLEPTQFVSGEDVVCPSCGSSFRLEGEATADYKARPQWLGKFQLLEPLGAGAFGTVYRAKDPELDRVVAIKVPRAGHLAGDQERDRFLREARSVAQLRHPGIVPVHEVGQQDGLPYLVCEFVQGVTLADRLTARRPSPSDAAKLMADVADALQYAHSQGVVHRDIKPSNIMIGDDGIPHVMDFGLAKRDTGEITMTLDGTILGTPAYMSPEQAGGESHQVDGRSDVYSLGVILYQLLTGELPFRGNKRMLLYQVLHDEPRPARRLNDRLPRDLDTICLKAMAKEPHRRYQTAGELADDLRRFLGGEPIHARPTPAWERGWKWAKRRPTAAALLGVIVVAVLGLLIGSWWHNVNLRFAKQQSDERRQQAETNLYHSLVGEARALRLARESGYRAKVWNRLKQARALDTPERDLEVLRGEAVACMGDFVGLQPTSVWKDHEIGRARGQRLALHPDGVRLALGMSDGTVLVRNLASGDEVALRDHDTDISAVAFAPDGKWLISGDMNGQVKVWASEAGGWTCTHSIKAKRPDDSSNFFGELSVAISPNSQQMAVCSGGSATILVWNLTDGKPVAEFHSPQGEQLRGLAWSPKGRNLLAAGYWKAGERGLLVWDVATRAPLRPLSLKGNVFTVTFSPDGHWLAAGSNQGTFVFDTSANFRTALVVRGDVVHSLVFSPYRPLLFITSVTSNLVRVWNVATNHQEAALLHPGGPFALALAADGSTLWSVAPRSVLSWQPGWTEEKRVLSGHDDGVPGLAFSPDGKLLASSGADQKVKVWNPRTGQLVKELSGFPGTVQAVAFSPDSRTLATADWAGDLRLWEVPTWKEEPARYDPAWKDHRVEHDLGGRLWDVVFSRDGAWFAASGDRGLRGGDGGLRIWRVLGREAGLDTSGPPLRIEANTSITALCFSPDSKRLAWLKRGQGSGAGEHEVFHCDEPFAKAKPRSLGYSYTFVRSPAFSPDGRTLTFVSKKRVVEVWNVDSEREVVSFGREELVSANAGIALSVDGTWLATPGNRVAIWDTASHNLLLALPEERSSVWALAWSPKEDLLAVSSSDGGSVIWNIRKIRAQLSELGLDW